MKKHLLILVLSAIVVCVSNAQTNLLKNGDMESQGAWQTLGIWYKPDIAPTEMVFGYDKTVPISGSGKCFHTVGTYDANPSWNEIKAGIWQPILLEKGHTYKVTGAFKDNSVAPIDNANWGTWVEIHFYYTPPVTGSSKTDVKLPNPATSLYTFNSWQYKILGTWSLGKDITIQDSASSYGLGAAAQTDATPAHPYYTVPDSVFATGKDTITLYFACQFGMTSNSADYFDFTMDEFSVIDSGARATTVQGNSIEASFNVYPNPVINELRFSNTKIILAQIFSVTGQQLKSVFGNEISSGINVSDLKEGMYIVRIKSSDGEVARKFIKK
jgi:hypothetical protein